jgi:hypothetical protein
MTLKTGDLIAIENTDNLKKPINEFHKKWAATVTVTLATATATAMETETAMAMATAMTEKQTGKKLKLKYYGTRWKPFEDNRLVGIVTEIVKEEHPDLDVIKIREQTGGVRYCRRYILENV